MVFVNNLTIRILIISTKYKDIVTADSSNLRCSAEIIMFDLLHWHFALIITTHNHKSNIIYGFVTIFGTYWQTYLLNFGSIDIKFLIVYFESGVLQQRLTCCKTSRQFYLRLKKYYRNHHRNIQNNHRKRNSIDFFTFHLR